MVHGRQELFVKRQELFAKNISGISVALRILGLFYQTRVHGGQELFVKWQELFVKMQIVSLLEF